MHIGGLVLGVHISERYFFLPTDREKSQETTIIFVPPYVIRTLGKFPPIYGLGLCVVYFCTRQVIPSILLKALPFREAPVGNDCAMKDGPCYLSCQVAIAVAYPAQHTQLKMANNHHLLMRAMPSAIRANDLHNSH